MFVKSLISRSVQHPVWTLIFWLGIVLLGAPSLADLRFETTARSFLDRHGEPWERYEQSVGWFGNDELVVIALQAPSPFDSETLRTVQEITARAERIRGVRRVDSLSSVPILRATADGALDLLPAIPSALSAARSGTPLREQVMERLVGDRFSPNTLVSADGRTLAINVFLERDVGTERARIVHEIRSLVEGEQAWVSGVPVFETRVSDSTRSELLRFVPLAFLLLVLVLAMSTHAPIGVVVPLVASSIPCILLLELMGALGFPFTMLSMLLPSVLLALGCAYVMHLLVACRGISETEPLLEAVLSVARPTALSGITTSLGFLAISMAPIEAIQNMGILGASGVSFALAASLTLAPALLRLYPRAEHPAAWDIWIEQRVAPMMLRWLGKRRKAVIGCWAVLLLVFMAGLTQLRLETDAVHWFSESSQIRVEFEQIREHLSGVSPINIVIEAPEPELSVASPAVVARIAALADYLESLPEVGRTLAISDALRQIHGGFSDDPSQPLPDRSALIQQYLLLLDSVDQLDDLITPDYERANVLVRMNHNGSRHLLGVAEKAEAWWREHGIEGVDAHATGVMYEFARSQEAITRGQLMGLGLALGVIGVILVWVVRSASTVAFSLIPNLIPLMIVFGFLGLAGMPLDAGIACLGSLALGIAVDDTTHIVLRYQDGLQRGVRREVALRRAFQAALPAVVLSTLAVSLGFGVMGLSEFILTGNVGLVTASIVTTCLVADATLLPALLAGPAARSLGRPRSTRVPRDPYLPPLYAYEAQAAEDDVLDGEELDEKAAPPEDGEEDWFNAAVAMNPGFDLSQASRAEQIALAMIDPKTVYSLAIDFSILEEKGAAQQEERVTWVHRLLWPIAMLEALRVMTKILLYRLRHLSWAWSSRGEERTRYLLGPRRVISKVADGSSPMLYALRQGVTTSAALDVLYNSPRTPARAGIPGALSWFWSHEPHAQGVRNRMKCVYASLITEMEAARERGAGPIRILSLACGSAQPVIEAVCDFLREHASTDVYLELVDIDAVSLRRAERLAYARGVHERIRLRRQNIRTFLEQDEREWTIVEMVGFLDYRDDASLVDTCRHVASRIAPGGCFMTATVCPSSWASVVRWLANWPFLVRRSKRSFRNLLRRAGFDSTRDRYVYEATRTFLMAYLYAEDPYAEGVDRAGSAPETSTP